MRTKTTYFTDSVSESHIITLKIIQNSLNCIHSNKYFGLTFHGLFYALICLANLPWFFQYRPLLRRYQWLPYFTPIGSCGGESMGPMGVRSSTFRSKSMLDWYSLSEWWYALFKWLAYFPISSYLPNKCSFLTGIEGENYHSFHISNSSFLQHETLYGVQFYNLIITYFCQWFHKGIVVFDLTSDIA